MDLDQGSALDPCGGLVRTRADGPDGGSCIHFFNAAWECTHNPHARCDLRPIFDDFFFARSHLMRFCVFRTVFVVLFVCLQLHPEPFWLKSGSKPPSLSFRCICHLGNPISFFLLCTSHGPCCLSPYHQVWEIWLYWILSALCGGIWVYRWEEASHVQDLWENTPATQCHSLRLPTCRK